jgi:D-psicose/D-tagatose/L-ribulose 3-epimerase
MAAMPSTSHYRAEESNKLSRPRRCAASAQRVYSPAQPLVPNRLGVHALVFSGSWNRADAERAILCARTAGYDFIEIPLLDPTTVDATMTQELLHTHGMEASASLGLNPHADISSEDRDIVAAGEQLLMTALACAAAFGSRYLCGILYSALHKYGTPSTATGRRNCVAALRRVCNAAAQDFGVTLCAEVVNRYETNLVNTAAQGLQLLDDVGSSQLKLHLDSYHMNIEENSMVEAIKLAGDQLRYVHIGESHRGYLGTGTVNFSELFKALSATGYSGPVCFESFSSKVVSPQLSNTLCVWRNVWDDSQDLAVHARMFMQSQIEAASKQM